ncbi:lycopene cyclase [Fulvivirga sp. M361]|uniref:lycopene cyclase family protein n=1 Tax=Fulvivirga sp. M361 TaxID=2594266 RepID=UPI00117AB6D1|nr:lycopene cyclase family protein [Fulvivirga sp. M361]TRX57543.1 lycopene cyclase [Fulvivirga sp. M361]
MIRFLSIFTLLNWLSSSTSMEYITYDYAIIGAGAAGLNLALCMLEDPFFDDKAIVIFDKDLKNANDRTWCFWEKGAGRWDGVVSHKWGKAVVTDTNTKQYTLSLDPFTYKMIHSDDFYRFAKDKIRASGIIDWVTAEVEQVNIINGAQEIQAQKRYLITRHTFDSRIASKFNHDTSSIKLLQHFKGWVVETDAPAFDPSAFVMMDFSLRWKDTTSFTYVLPFSATKALVEFTLFSPDLIQNEEYDTMLKQYVTEILDIKKYNILASEQGVIPMSDYPFHHQNNDSLTKIGTAGAWVKPSSGYSFKNTERYSLRIIDNIKKGLVPSKNIIRKKYRYYDSVFLNVLYHRNELGPELFTIMYGKNPIEKIFDFLDEQTSLLDDIRIMNTFPKAPFNKAVFRKLVS